MSLKVVRFSVVGMMVLATNLALGGCVAPEGDELANDEAVNTESVDSELASSVVTVIEPIGKGPMDGAPQALHIETRNVTCNSGWPGTRGCHWVFNSPTNINNPSLLSAVINGHNGEIGHTVAQTGLRTVDLTATVREGDAFNPGVNTTSYTVTWLAL